MRHAPTRGPYSAHDRACKSSTPARSTLPIGPTPGALSSVQPSSITLTETASGLPSGQPAGSVTGAHAPTIRVTRRPMEAISHTTSSPAFSGCGGVIA